LRIVDQLVETPVRLAVVAELAPRQPLVEDHIRRLVVVEHRARRFLESQGSFAPAAFGFFCAAQRLVRAAEIIVDMVLLRARELPFAQVLRVGQSAREPLDRLVESSLRQRGLAQLYMRQYVLAGDLAFAAFPRMEMPA